MMVPYNLRTPHSRWSAEGDRQGSLEIDGNTISAVPKTGASSPEMARGREFHYAPEQWYHFILDGGGETEQRQNMHF